MRFEFCFSKFCFGKLHSTMFSSQNDWALDVVCQTRTFLAYSSDWSHLNFGRKNVNNHAQISKDEWIPMRDGEDINIFVRFCRFLSWTSLKPIVLDWNSEQPRVTIGQYAPTVLTGEAWGTKTSCTRRESRRALIGKRDIVAVCACCAIARIFKPFRSKTCELRRGEGSLFPFQTKRCGIRIAGSATP